MNFKLTQHAASRITERSTTQADDLLQLITSAGIDVLLPTDKIAYRLVWSPQDQAAFILVTDRADGTVITVIPAQHEDGRARGFDNGKGGTFRIKQFHLEQAIKLAGADLSKDVFFKPEFKDDRTWNYRWVVRSITQEGVKCKDISKFLNMPIDGTPPAEVLDAARELSSGWHGWDARLSLIGRDDPSPVDEWEL